MIFPVRARRLSEDRLRVRPSIAWRAAFLTAGGLFTAGGIGESAPLMAAFGALLLLAGSHVEYWEVDKPGGRITYARGLVLPFSRREYPLADLAAVRVERFSGRWSREVDDPGISGDRHAMARGFRRGFARLVLQFESGQRRAIQRDTIRAYESIRKAASCIAVFTGVELIDQ